MPTNGKQFFDGEMDIPLQKYATFFSVSKRDFFVNDIYIFFNPATIFLNIFLLNLVEVNFANVVEEGYNRNCLIRDFGSVLITQFSKSVIYVQ